MLRALAEKEEGFSVLRTAGRAVLRAASSVLGGSRGGCDGCDGCGSYVLKVSQDTWEPGNGWGKTPIIITSDTSWYVSSDKLWLTASSYVGSGNAGITLFVDGNSGLTARKGTITVKTWDGKVSKKITVRQFGQYTIDQLFANPSDEYYHPLAKYALQLSIGAYIPTQAPRIYFLI